MSFLMPKMPSYTPPAAMGEIDKAQAEREARLEAQEKSEKKKLASRSRARRTNRRLLYSADRANPILGIPDTSTAMAPVRNPMDTTRRYV